MTTITLSSKNQIVLPAEARKKLGVSGGDKLIVTVDERGVTIRKQPTIYDFVGIAGRAKGDPVKRTRAIRDELDERVG